MNSEASTPVVHTRLDGSVLVVTIDNPPVNALGVAVRSGLLQAVELAHNSPDIQAVLLVGKGKAFIAGADIREFGKPPMPPSLPQVLELMETGSKLVVAAIHGPALGGGLEVALAAHYRLALPAAKLGLPEVNLGLLPGAGGTQRAPRVMGVKAATELMLSGKHISAAEALESGLVDRVAEGSDPEQAGLAYVNELLAAKAPIRRTRDIAIADKAAALAELDALQAATAKKARGLMARFMLEQQPQVAEDLKAFNSEGYYFDADNSTAQELVFKRDEQAA